MNERQDMNRPVIEEFRGAGGRVGGYFEGMDLLLLHHVGAKSGTEYVSPLARLDVDGGESWAIVASNGGRDTHPAWLFNLRVRPETSVEVPDGAGGVATRKVRARVAGDEERDELYTAVKAAMPQFAQYEAGTTRRIPVVLLEPVG